LNICVTVLYISELREYFSTSIEIVFLQIYSCAAPVCDVLVTVLSLL